ncbi:MAG: zinc-ribbon domain-containing protein [Clostridia bacterium]|nr:zinc-ribbon domain-containing protein [Clostridia bacterium]
MDKFFCINCGTEMNESAKFCPVCGAKQETAQEVAATEPVAEETAANEETTPVLEQPESAPAPQPVQQPVYQEAASETTPKKKNKLWLIIVAAVLVLAILGGGVFGALTVFASPEVKILRAFNKTLKSGSFSYELSTEHSYDEGYKATSEMEGTVVLDFDEKEMSVFSESNSKSEYDGDEYSSSSRTLIYEGKAYYIDDEDWADIDEYDEDMVEAFFDFYEENGGIKAFKLNWDAVYDLMKELNIYNDFKEVFDKQEFVEAFEEAIDENIPEFKKDGSTYTAKVDLQKYLEELLETFEDAFEEKSMYRNLEDELDDFEDIDLEISVTLSKGYISKIDIEMSDENNSITYEIKLSDFGKAEIDKDDIESFIEECEEASDNDDYYDDDYDYDEDDDYYYSENANRDDALNRENPDFDYDIYGDDPEFYDEEGGFYYYYDGYDYYYYDKDLEEYFFYDEYDDEWY